MSKELVISATPHETRVAILEDGHLCEIYVEREKEFALVGSIYKGRVTRVLPGMQSAFVEIGLDSDAFLYVSDFFENLEDYEGIATTVEGKQQRMEQQSGPVFSTPAAAAAPAIEPPEVMADEPPAPSSLVSSDAPPMAETPAPAPHPSAPPPASFPMSSAAIAAASDAAVEDVAAAAGITVAAGAIAGAIAVRVANFRHRNMRRPPEVSAQLPASRKLRCLPATSPSFSLANRWPSIATARPPRR
ncbi:MAG TPA: hypothetical protein VIG89_00190 [Candidatus Acidoferrales bacterium]